MPSGSEVNRYIDSSAADGRADSSGEFTLAAKEAIRKLAKSLLPYKQACAIKIIQAIVAGGSTKPIKVKCSNSSVTFSFLEPGFNLDELARAYFNPQPPNNRSLAHLVTALRSAGMGQGWKFWVYLPQQNDILVWDGQDLRQEKSKKHSGYATICVFSRSDEVTTSATSVSDGVAEFLAQKCYVCPVPLIVDGKRLDFLQKAQFQGWSETRFPIVLGVAEAELPSFGLPPGSYDRKKNQSQSYKRLWGEYSNNPEEVWRYFAIGEMSALSPHYKASVAYLLSVHMKEKSFMVEPSGESVGRSKLYWVLDGAVIQAEDLFTYRSFCSLGCFISAQGLLTDLSGLNLVDSPDKNKRRELACAALAGEVPKHDCLSLSRLARMRRRWLYPISIFLLSFSVLLFYLCWLVWSVGKEPLFNKITTAAYTITLGPWLALASISILLPDKDCLVKLEPQYKESIKKLSESLLDKNP